MDVTNNSQNKLHPALWVAAVAVTLFSLVGIAAVTGLLPTGKAESPAASPPAAATALAPQPTVAPPATVSQNASAPAPAKVASAPRQTSSAAQTRRVANTESDIDVYRSEPRRYDDRQARPAYTASSEPSYTPQSSACYNCGVIESVTPVVEKGEGTGLGGVLGGVAGAIVGNQIGKGSGRDVARVVGIAGGAYAGHQIEKSQRGRTYYDIAVRMDEGGVRHVRSDNPPAWQAGDRVRYEDGRIYLR